MLEKYNIYDITYHLNPSLSFNNKRSLTTKITTFLEKDY